MKENKRKSSLIVNIILIGSIIGLVVALVGIFTSMRKYRVASNEYQLLAETYTPVVEGGRTMDFAGLRAINPDFIGWLEIPGTKLSYPVAKGVDNDYYINNTFEGTYNPSGGIFLDTRNAGDLSDTNSIFYGHNMKDKSMFATVQNYCVDREYRNLHDTIYLYTEEATYVYSVFAVRQTNIEDTAYQLSFADETAQNRFLEEMDGESGTLSPGDQIITLSTCVNDSDPNTPNRFIVQAVLSETAVPLPQTPGVSSVPIPAAG